MAATEGTSGFGTLLQRGDGGVGDELESSPPEQATMAAATSETLATSFRTERMYISSLWN